MVGTTQPKPLSEIQPTVQQLREQGVSKDKAISDTNYECPSKMGERVWISALVLTEADKERLVSGKWLNSSLLPRSC